MGAGMNGASDNPRFEVEKVFQLADRGCVLVPGFSLAAEPVRVGSPIRLVRPDGSLLRSIVRGVEMVDWPAVRGDAVPISLPGLLKASDVPIGTVVELEDATFLFDVHSSHRLAGVGLVLEPGTERSLLTSTVLLVWPDGMVSVAPTRETSTLGPRTPIEPMLVAVSEPRVPRGTRVFAMGRAPHPR